jgi:hypothetical protein
VAHAPGGIWAKRLLIDQTAAGQKTAKDAAALTVGEHLIVALARLHAARGLRNDYDWHSLTSHALRQAFGALA